MNHSPAASTVERQIKQTGILLRDPELTDADRAFLRGVRVALHWQQGKTWTNPVSIWRRQREDNPAWLVMTSGETR